ncbi:SH3 domain-containing protein [Capnocytophaga gingivalis]
MYYLKTTQQQYSYTISKIRNGEEVRVVEDGDEGDWLLIITTDGIKGYIHKNNIKIEIKQ